jgi:hypothetical protein
MVHMTTDGQVLGVWRAGKQLHQSRTADPDAL